MNIIDAIKSDKRFRRKNYDGAWFMARKDVYDIQPLNLDYASIVADDWEVEEGPVTITREKFNAAWDNSLRNEPRNNWELHAFLIKHLGL